MQKAESDKGRGAGEKRRSRIGRDRFLIVIVLGGGRDRLQKIVLTLIVERQWEIPPFSATVFICFSFFFFLFLNSIHQSTRPTCFKNLLANGGPFCAPACPFFPGTCRTQARRLSTPCPPISGHCTHVTARGAGWCLVPSPSSPAAPLPYLLTHWPPACARMWVS